MAFDESAEGIDEAQVGPRLKQLRQDRGWVLSRLAAETGLSEAFLSRIETGARTPSLGTIIAVARALGVRIGDIFDEPDADESYVLHRHDEHADDVVGGVMTGLASRAPWASMEAVRLVMAADHPGALSRHAGEEFVLVLSGAIRVELGAERLRLEEGDSIHFDADLEHLLAAEGGAPATVLLVVVDAKPVPGAPHPHASY
ncbi:helix-turn-helix domain-containing protein [Agromyces mediolanus]|uniref:DNA-binding protein n=1 Tax=Agromyces mediolanus TaxID=41986 RepID=A0A918FED4_AGRME|nr:XRE family transcriptional regulator [Agromyces mediolanus]GGR29023.1 DNA-binding protein [Agromyces mediolanus]GLJ72158.1 DNA-binding protein [Agromyces mediolanus]